jgi:hypothetical protein
LTGCAQTGVILVWGISEAVVPIENRSLASLALRVTMGTVRLWKKAASEWLPPSMYLRMRTITSV